MTEVTVDGKRYRPVNEAEADSLGELIRTFTSEGSTFWEERFKRDSAEGMWNESMYGEGDETAPFFTEAFLYNLVGKDDARTVLGIIRRLSVLAGVEFRWSRR